MMVEQIKSEKTAIEAREVELDLILEAVFQKYGYDFRQYAKSSIHRRLELVLVKFQFQEPLDFLHAILRDHELFERSLPHFTVGTTEMFRDPDFFLTLRRDVIPILKTYPTLNIWSAGCSTGEELYSLAILLKEEGLYDRTVIFGTDLNQNALRLAQEGIFPQDVIESYAKNYSDAGGSKNFHDYYTAAYGNVRMDSELKRNFVLSTHNLTADSVFAECQLILCRNVMIYFNKLLQERALDLFCDFLPRGSFLCLGSKENLKYSKTFSKFDIFNEKWRIYRRKPNG
jgi:chemotaxis protein methyltransferase CheR